MFQRTIIGLLSLLIVWLATFGNQNPIKETLQNSAVVPVATLPDNDQENSSDDTYKIVAYEAVLPLVHANVSVLFYFFTKAQVIFDTVVEAEPEYQLPFISYFNTLFRLIISPNAP